MKSATIIDFATYQKISNFHSTPQPISEELINAIQLLVQQLREAHQIKQTG